jgi:hypothetical protein
VCVCVCVCVDCKQWKALLPYFKALGVSPAFMDPNFNKCYCVQCAGPFPLRAKSTGTGGDKQMYARALGWSRWGVKVHAKHKDSSDPFQVNPCSVLPVPSKLDSLMFRGV